MSVCEYVCPQRSAVSDLLEQELRAVENGCYEPNLGTL